MLSLKDRKTAILGGSAGIGLATAALLQERGAEVIVGGRDEARLAEAEAVLAPGARTFRVDATDAESLRGFYQQAGPVDDLVITVSRRGGAGPARSLPELDLLESFTDKPAAHLRAVAMALPTLDQRGSVTLVGAGSARSALPGTDTCLSSKIAHYEKLQGEQ